MSKNKILFLYEFILLLIFAQLILCIVAETKMFSPIDNEQIFERLAPDYRELKIKMANIFLAQNDSEKAKAQQIFKEFGNKLIIDLENKLASDKKLTASESVTIRKLIQIIKKKITTSLC